jgi:hypothetical protein
MPERTLVDGNLSLDYKAGVLDFGGQLAIQGLSLFHPMVARTPVLDLAGTARVKGRLDPGEERLEVSELVLASRGVDVELEGTIDRVTSTPRIAVRLHVPELPCQKVLDAFPPSLLPQLQGFVLKGQFSADISSTVDFANLEEVTLGGEVGIYRCKVESAPEAVSAERLEGDFVHQVEATPESMLAFVVGSENPEFVPYDEISPNVVIGFLTTEDGGFFRHRGYIPSMFRKALSRNLQSGGFRLGASTITMQMIKNVLLTHQKTMSRKLQELFLTWYLEQELEKERIMEIYLNVIEFGPGIYGIGPAARHYFGKEPRDITPLEAAFFASILPSPKRRYVQYCRGELTPRWDKRVRRIVRRMGERKYLSDEEVQAALEQQLTFARDLEMLSVEECNRQREELLDAWHEEGIRRLREAVLSAAPHQLEMHVPAMPVKTGR